MTHTTVQNSDISLAASVHGDAAAPPVLLLHGLSSSRDTWDEAVLRLADKFQMWTIDLRGHGHSEHSDSYVLGDYVTDAAAALDVIGRPTIVVGHSLGAVIAGALGQASHPLVRAVFLEDPPWYMGERSEWEKGIFRTVFPILRDQQIEMQERSAPLTEWIDVSTSAPSPKGGVFADHVSSRHVMATASARMRHDPLAWDAAINHDVFAELVADDPIAVPLKLVRADPTLGPAFMAEHVDRFLASNPHADIVEYGGAPHGIHASNEHAERFLDDLASFLTEP